MSETEKRHKPDTYPPYKKDDNKKKASRIFPVEPDPKKNDQEKKKDEESK